MCDVAVRLHRRGWMCDARLMVDGWRDSACRHLMVAGRAGCYWMVVAEDR